MCDLFTAVQTRCYPVMGCDDTLTTNLELMITGAGTVSECCTQPNVISVQEQTSCVICKMMYKFIHSANVT